MGAYEPYLRMSTPLVRVKKYRSYPLSTPSTRLSIKNDPMMIRGTKYAHVKLSPIASFVYHTIR